VAAIRKSARGIGATQRSFAQAIGVSVKTLRNWEQRSATDRPRPRLAHPGPTRSAVCCLRLGEPPQDANGVDLLGRFLLARKPTG
jgi:hypothetical protein